MKGMGTPYEGRGTNPFEEMEERHRANVPAEAPNFVREKLEQLCWDWEMVGRRGAIVWVCKRIKAHMDDSNTTEAEKVLLDELYDEISRCTISHIERAEVRHAS